MIHKIYICVLIYMYICMNIHLKDTIETVHFQFHFMCLCDISISGILEYNLGYSSYTLTCF